MRGPASKPTPEAISLQHAAVVLGVSERTLRRWGKSGRLELVRVGPKLLRVPRDVLARLRRQREQVGAPPTRQEPTADADRLRQDVEHLASLLRDDDDAPAFLVTSRHI